MYMIYYGSRLGVTETKNLEKLRKSKTLAMIEHWQLNSETTLKIHLKISWENKFCFHEQKPLTVKDKKLASF